MKEGELVNIHVTFMDLARLLLVGGPQLISLLCRLTAFLPSHLPITFSIGPGPSSPLVLSHSLPPTTFRVQTTHPNLQENKTLLQMALTFSPLSRIPKPSPARSPPLLYGAPSKTNLLRIAPPTANPSSVSIFSRRPKSKYVSPNPRSLSIRSLFTGIVEEMGQIKQLGRTDQDGVDLKILASVVLEGVNLGDSIAVNGTCLTVTHFDHGLLEFTVGLSPETLRKTSLSELKPGSLVNLERAIQPTGRMGGHFVQGHVDGTGEIVGMDAEGDSLWIKVRADRGLMRYIVPKGFIAVDGTSLTVVDVFDEECCFNFMLVAYTQQKIVIPLKKVGEKVNLEVDILGKYVERIVSGGLAQSIRSS